MSEQIVLSLLPLNPHVALVLQIGAYLMHPSFYGGFPSSGCLKLIPLVGCVDN